jgi:biotin transport system substrate-specific component
MSTVVAAEARPRVLADVVPRVRARDVALVLAAVALTAACAQLTFYLPGSSVPVTGQTFAVLLSGAALGATRGGIAMLLYIAIGMVGLPVYAGGGHGTHAVFGATGGYLFGFLAASWAVGRLAEARMDRTPVKALPTFVLGSALVYLIGVPWLAISAHMSLGTAIDQGLTPFLAGDAVKALAAAGLLPAAWSFVSRGRK